jgi:hypothetical protein
MIFLKNMIEDTGDKFLIIGKENDRNYWSGTLDPKWYTELGKRSSYYWWIVWWT